MRRCHPDRYPTAASVGAFTLVEVMVALVIMMIISVTLLQYLKVNFLATNDQRNRVFAYARAQAILSELHALVESSNVTAAIDLDEFDDGAVRNPVLSITEENGVLVDPSHPISRNTMVSVGWQWSRRIKVRPFATVQNRSVRYVTVQIFRNGPDGNETELASVSSVINSVSSSFPTTQTYDVYLLAIENIPGWWVFMENIVPSVEAAITDLESRNPGLSLRTHWITKASYGRNQQYTPYINSSQDSHQDVPYAYYYPGAMPAGN